MAAVRLSDIIDPVVFTDLPAVNGPEKTAFSESGIVIRTPKLDQLANGEGRTAEMPYWNDLDPTDELNYSSDDPASSATPSKVGQAEQTARKAFVNKGWSTADLVNEVAMGPRAMDHIRSRTDRYFARQWQRRIIAAIKGVLADNVANDSGDMVIDVASESVAGQSATTRFNRTSFTAAMFTLGDSIGQLSAIAVHSHIMQQMVDNDDIIYLPDSQGNPTIATYMGLRVIVDDSMPVVAGTTDGFKYTSAIFGPGALGWGDGTPTTPVEIQRYADQADGGGVETLWVRKTWLLHPLGFRIKVGAAPAAVSFTLAELAAAATWDRVVDRKLVPMAFLVTN